MSKILLIEEDTAMQMLVREWLSAEGYEVRVPVPGRVAANDEFDRELDLVIVNVLNLRAQGAAVLKDIQAVYPGSALIGLSTQLGRSLDRDSDVARQLGVSHLVAKPFSRSELIDAVVGVIGRAH